MMKFVFPILIGCFLVAVEHAEAAKICVKKKTQVGFTSFAKNIKKVDSGNCPRGFKELIDTSSFQGPAGSDGSNGADGALEIYGNGNQGALIVTGNVTLPAGDHQYTNVTIDTSATLTVESGSTIRCTGSFENRGTLNVPAFTSGAVRSDVSDTDIEISASAPGPGITSCPAGNGAYGTSAAIVRGALNGCGIPEGSSAQILRLGAFGGGGGGVGGSTSLVAGGAGGGTVRVLCKTSIQNSGFIYAVGQDSPSQGGGGGGGGIVILASSGSITNTGALSVYGGDGGDSSAKSGAGGGGGGGLVHLLAPTITQNGTIALAGGIGGTLSIATTAAKRFGGGAGGDGTGYGGNGADINTDNSSTAGEDGQSGLSFQTLTDPTSLL